MSFKHHVTLTLASYLGITTVLMSSTILKLVDSAIKWALVSEGRCAICMKLKPGIRYESVVCADCSKLISDHQSCADEECECEGGHYPFSIAAKSDNIMYR